MDFRDGVLKCGLCPPRRSFYMRLTLPVWLKCTGAHKGKSRDEFRGFYRWCTHAFPKDSPKYNSHAKTYHHPKDPTFGKVHLYISSVSLSVEFSFFLNFMLLFRCIWFLNRGQLETEVSSTQVRSSLLSVPAPAALGRISSKVRMHTRDAYLVRMALQRISYSA
jgi:hypothetical protein